MLMIISVAISMAHNPSADALNMLLKQGTLTNDEYHMLTSRIISRATASIGTSRKLMDATGTPLSTPSSISTKEESMGTTSTPIPGEEGSSGTGKTVGLVVAPLASFLLLGIFGYAGIRLTGDLAADIVEEMSEAMDFKQFVQSTLANVGIVSALILSIVISMMQFDKPDGLTVLSAICWEVYVAVCFLAAEFSSQGVVTSAFRILHFSQLS